MPETGYGSPNLQRACEISRACREIDGYRDAQGVLRLPADFSEYLRGRHRQAVRTNVGHARRAGLRAEVEFVPDWAPGGDDSRLAYITPGPVERWNLLTAEGAIAAQAILSVDTEVALLQGMMSLVPHGRWLLHTTMIERLCGSCEVLLINCDDAYLMSPGVQYFQRLLGYDIARLRLDRTRSPRCETVYAVGAGEVTANVEA